MAFVKVPGLTDDEHLAAPQGIQPAIEDTSREVHERATSNKQRRFAGDSDTEIEGPNNTDDYPIGTSISMHVPTWLVEKTDHMIATGQSPYSKKNTGVSNS